MKRELEPYQMIERSIIKKYRKDQLINGRPLYELVGEKDGNRHG